MSRPLHVDVSDLAKAQILAAEEWWRVNRAKAPNAVREDLERASYTETNQSRSANSFLDHEITRSPDLIVDYPSS